MYLASTFSSILNGLGKTGLTFALNMGCTLVRIFAVWILGPRYGIYGVLIAFLAGQLLAAAIFSFAIHRYIPLSFHAVRLIVIPSVCAFFASAVARLIYKSLQAPEFFRLCLAGIVLAGIYGGCVWWLEGKGE
jgi:stage V sporulation protein B